MTETIKPAMVQETRKQKKKCKPEKCQTRKWMHVLILVLGGRSMQEIIMQPDHNNTNSQYQIPSLPTEAKSQRKSRIVGQCRTD